MAPAVRIPGRRESAVSMAVVGLLAVVAAGVLVKQAHFNPAVSALSAAGGQGGAGAGKEAGTAIVSPVPAGLETMSPPESFDRETLSDKIDGRAELYLAAGFVGLKAQRFRLTDESSTWVEAFVYDMGSARNAYAVFSSQRRAGAGTLAFVRNGYRTGNSECFAAGSLYVEIVASKPGKRAMGAVDALGRALAGNAPEGRDDSVADGALLPAEGQVSGSVQLTVAGAFGFAGFSNVFSAKYRDGGDTATLFLSRRASAGEAAGLSDAWREFLAGLDGSPVDAPEGCWLMDVDGFFEGAFVSGSIVAGVHQASSAAVASRLLPRLRAAISAGGAAGGKR